MQLLDLISPLTLKEVKGDVHTDIQGIEVDSRQTHPGDLFVCLPGFTVDGHDYAAAAVKKGASAILANRKMDLGIATVVVPDTRRALAILADRFYDHPTKQLHLIGVTGTNGKTTVTHMIDKIFGDSGQKTGLIGTIKQKIGEEVEELSNTTPDILHLQKSFSRMTKAGVKYATIEVSSHALDQGRVWGCDFRTAVFTNLSQDHLDYHQTMENYRDAKSLLFSQLGNSYNEERSKFAILNADDPVSILLAKRTAAQVITYGIDKKANVRAKKIQINGQRTEVEIETFKGEVTLSLRLLGKFSVYNALAAMAATLVEGVPLARIKTSLESMNGVSGRFERIAAGQDFNVIVDYAHTPDGLKNVMQTISEFAAQNIYCVVGCGGDRDRAKRPLMASIAAKYADHVFLTSDNPRSEDPVKIIEDMRKGLENERIPSDRYTCMTDRKEAIEAAVQKASAGDVVLIAGKGHETYQIIGAKRLPFDDREVAKGAILKRFMD